MCRAGALMLPPIGCHDQRLWLQANDLAQGHVSERGFCIACGSPSPCRVLDAAQDAMRRAMTPPPEPPHPEPPPDLPPMAPPRPPAVGARFRRVRDDEENLAQPADVDPQMLPPAPAEPPAPTEPPVGARFRYERRIGRRRRTD